MRSAQLLVVAAWVSGACAPAPRAAAQVTVPEGFREVTVVRGLEEPCGIAFLPDGRLLVVEQRTAHVLVVAKGSNAAVEIGAVPGVSPRGNERGLLGIAVDPHWPAKPYVYVHSTQIGFHVNITRFRVSGDLDGSGDARLTLDPASRFDLVDDIPDRAFNHNGGSVRFGPDGMLYVSLGEDATPSAAQDTSTLRGVILRLDVSRLPDGPGTAARDAITPADNPFVKTGGPNARLVWEFGLRNPFRFSVDPEGGGLMIADVGQNRWEEMDWAPHGGMNFGWPHFEANEINSDEPLVGSATPPIYAVDHMHARAASIMDAGIYHAPAGATAAFPPEYRGSAFFSDYYAGFMRRLVRHGDTWMLAKPVPGQPSPEDWGRGFGSVCDYATGPDGALWYCRQFAHGGGGTICRLEYGARTPGTRSGRP